LPKPRASGSFFPAILFLSVAFPITLFGWTTWREREWTLADAERIAARTTAALHEHAAKVLENHELVLDELNRQTSRRSWEDIEHHSVGIPPSGGPQAGCGGLLALWRRPTTFLMSFALGFAKPRRLIQSIKPGSQHCPE
jgi:hypothetical protein